MVVTFYKNVWNPATQYFQSKSKDGSLVSLFDPLQLTYTDWDKEYTKDYVEGSALQWRWAVPFDPQGLIGLFKDKDYFVTELNDFFEKSDPKKAAWTPGSFFLARQPARYSCSLLVQFGGQTGPDTKMVTMDLAE